MVNSINTNIAAYYAQQNINVASMQASFSVARLSSGNRIVRSADDVAALAAGTSLRTAVTTLRTALTNASQGTSLLQVADGALSQITDILQRQKAIALQAGSGSLQNSDRAFLNQEFQALSSEINRLTASTTFNGVKLIDGDLSDKVGVDSNASNAAASSLSINFTAIADTNTIVLNGVTLTFKDSISTSGDVQRGTSVAQSLDNLVAYLNNVNNNTNAYAVSAANKPKLSNAVYSRVGNSLVVTSRTGGSLSEFFTVNALAGVNGIGSSTATVNAKGLETTATITGINVSTIDTDVSGTGTGDHFDSTLVLFDALTVATVANGDTLRGVVNKINANTSTTGVSAFITGTTGNYTLTLRSSSAVTGALAAGSNTGLTLNAAATNTIQSRFGGGATGLGQASVIGFGNTGGSFSILTDQTQQAAQSVISFPDIAAGDLTSTSNFGTARTITIEGQVFTFTQTAKTAKAQTEITIGSTLQETLDNAVEAINGFYGASSVNYAFRQIEATRNGNSIVIRNRQAGNALDQTGGTLDIAISLMTGAAKTSADLSNTSNTGIDTTGVMNAAWQGTIQGFQASYVSADTVNLSITVGGITYTAQNVDTTPTSNTDVRLISETGGYFDMKLRANQGLAVNGSADANAFVQKLDAAFSGVTFYQKRDVSSYATTGSLLGSSVKMQLDNFDNINVSDIQVTAPAGSNPNGSISFTVNGEVYTAQVPLGNQLGAYSITRFVSSSDANKFIEFRNGANAQSLATDNDAAELEQKLRTAFGVGEGAGALSFQIGVTNDDTLSVSIGKASTDKIYGGRSLDVLTQASAAFASGVLDDALDDVTSIRANVGALQSRFNFASANIQISIQNQDAARGELLDTDIAGESTNYATSQVRLQAGISVLAQANASLQAFLKLIA